MAAIGQVQARLNSSLTPTTILLTPSMQFLLLGLVLFLPMIVDTSFVCEDTTTDPSGTTWSVGDKTVFPVCKYVRANLRLLAFRSYPVILGMATTPAITMQETFIDKKTIYAVAEFSPRPPTVRLSILELPALSLLCGLVFLYMT